MHACLKPSILLAGILLVATGACADAERAEAVGLGRLLNHYSTELQEFTASDPARVDEINGWMKQTLFMGKDGRSAETAMAYSRWLESNGSIFRSARQALEQKELKHPYTQMLRSQVVQKIGPQERRFIQVAGMLDQASAAFPRSGVLQAPGVLRTASSTLGGYASPGDVLGDALRELREKYSITDAELVLTAEEKTALGVASPGQVLESEVVSTETQPLRLSTSPASRPEETEPLEQVMNRFLESVRNEDSEAFQRFFSASQPWSYVLNISNVDGDVRQEQTVTPERLRNDLAARTGYYSYFLDPSNRGVGSLGSYAESGEAWKLGSGNKFLPPTEASTTWVTWRNEGGRWVVDEIAEYYH